MSREHEDRECPEGQESQQKKALEMAIKFQKITDGARVGKCTGHSVKSLDLFGLVVNACHDFEVSLRDANKFIENGSDAAKGYVITGINILLPRLYEHTHNWPELAQKFTENLITLLRSYIRDLFQKLCGDKMQDLRNTLMEDMLARCKTALSCIEQIIEIERYAMNRKNDLADTLNEMRTQPIEADLKPYTNDSKGQPCTRNMISVSNLDNMRKNAQVVDDPHATLMADYEVTCRRVIDTIIGNVDNWLLRGEDNPLTIRYISVLSKEEKAEVTTEQLDLLNRGEQFRFPSYTTADDLAAVPNDGFKFCNQDLSSLHPKRRKVARSKGE